MATRLILHGRVLGTGRYGGDPRCLCGEPVRILGRCLECHEALRRRRLGLPPLDVQEKKRLDGYLEKHQAMAGKCAAELPNGKPCEATANEPHAPGCPWAD